MTDQSARDPLRQNGDLSQERVRALEAAQAGTCMRINRRVGHGDFDNGAAQTHDNETTEM